MRDPRVKLALIRAMGRTAKAGLRAASAAPSKGKKKRRAKADCTPCAAMAMVDSARERASGGGL